MTDHEMRQAWNDTDSRLNTVEPLKDFDLHRKTALQSLARRYQVFSRLGLGMTVCSAVELFSKHLFGSWHYILPICFCAFFALAGIMDYWLYRGIKSIDINTMPVSEVARKAIFYRRRHLQFIAVLLPLAVGIFALMLLSFGPDRYMVAGMVCGLIVGLAIGIRQLIAFMADYRTLRRL